MTEDNSHQRQLAQVAASLAEIQATFRDYRATVEARLAAAEPKLAEIRAIFAAFDWEHDDRQYALERIEMIVANGPQFDELFGIPVDENGAEVETDD